MVPPYLVAALVCDAAVTDPSTHKKSLIGIFDRLNAGSFPTQRQMALYVKVTDAQGYYPVRIDFVRVNSDTLLAQAEGQMTATERTQSLDAHFDFPPLPIPEEARCEFRIHASNMYLGSAFLNAVPRRR